MIVEKSLSVPQTTGRVVLHFPFDGLQAYSPVLSHMKMTDEGLVCSEGSNYCGQVPYEDMRIFGAADEIYAFSDMEARVYLIHAEKSLPVADKEMLNRVVAHMGDDGTLHVFSVTDNKIYRFCSGETIGVSLTDGGTCIAFHYERMFVGKGMRIYYSAPLSYNTRKDVSTQGVGYIDLPSGYGDILELVSYRDKLYLFRERGITAVTAFADTLNFKAVSVPYGLGQIVPNTVVCCGDKVYFFSEYGLCAFNGTSCEKIREATAGKLALHKTANAVTYRNQFYAAARGLDGKSYIYNYDPITGYGRILCTGANFIAAGDGLYWLSGYNLYQLGEKSLPDYGEVSLTIRVPLSKYATKACYVESVVVEGESMGYELAVTLTSESGKSYTVKGKMGKRLRFPNAVSGSEFNLSVIMQEKDFVIRSVTLFLRKENRYDD